MSRRLEGYLFYLFIFLAPWQVRKILVVWNHPGAPVFNEWNAVFLYGTDLLIGVLLLNWLVRARGQIVFSLRRWSAVDWSLLCFLGLAAVSLTVASNGGLGFYRLIKLAEFVGLFYYISRSAGKVFHYSPVLMAIIASGFFQALLAIGQAVKQESLGLRWLGESVLRTNFYGVAVVPFDGGKFLRAYGSTPHPNILAAWLFLAIWSFYFWYLYAKKERPRWLMLVIYVPLLWGFLFTFSRGTIALWLAGAAAQTFLVLLRRKHYHVDPAFLKRIRNLVLVSVGAALIFSYFYWPQVQSRMHISSEEQAVTQRIAYHKIAGLVTEDHPWLGIGVGQFVWNMFDSFRDYPAYFYQPVHNIYLLISSEIGLLGAAAFGLFIFCLIRSSIPSTGLKLLWRHSFLLVAVSMLVMGLLDHFLWTIQQGQIMLWLTLAFLNRDSLSGQKVI